MYTREFITF